MGRGLFMSVIGGAAGALVWSVVAFYTGWSFGILAVLLGALTGAGMVWGVRRQGTVGTGVAAAVIALVCIIGAKFVVGQALAGDYVQRAAMVTEADAIDHYAGEVYDAYSATGRYMGAPDGSGWPPEVMKEARRLWSETPEDERKEYLAAVSRDALREAKSHQFASGLMLFAMSFGWMDIVFLGLAVATAYRTGRHNSDEVHEVQTQATPNADGLVGGPLSRGAPAGGGGGQTVSKAATKPAPGKKKVELDDDDRRGAGIFARLAEIEERETSKATETKKAA